MGILPTLVLAPKSVSGLLPVLTVAGFSFFPIPSLAFSREISWRLPVPNSFGAKDEFSHLFAGKNFGVGCKGGVEVVSHTLRDFVSHNTGKGLAALKIDFRNAFNCVDRSAFLSSVHQSFPGLYAWTEWCYGSPLSAHIITPM